MEKYMEEYLIWRFTNRIPNRYKHYCMQWISGVTSDQLSYFILERERLIKMGIYKVQS